MEEKTAITPKPVKERHNLDLLQLVCELYSKALAYPSKEMHDAYVEARLELENRLAPQREDGFLKALDEKIESDKREAKKYNIDTSKGVLFGFNDGLEYARDLYTSTLTKK